MSNNLIRGVSEEGGVAFCALDSTLVVREMERVHQTSAVTSAALGRLLTAAGLMGSMLKSPQNTVSLRVRGDGPAGTVFAKADGAGHVKGYVEQPIVELAPRADGKLDVGGAVGSRGTLTVCRDLGLKEPYTGQVPLVSGEIAQDVTAYYAYSEQTPTVCALGVLVDRDLSILKAGGFLLQLLPGAGETEIERLEGNISRLSSVTKLLQAGKTPLDMMRLALQGFAPQVLGESEVIYQCDCTRERVERALLSLGREELLRLREEGDPVEVTCQFCDKKYDVSVAKLLQENP